MELSGVRELINSTRGMFFYEPMENISGKQIFCHFGREDFTMNDFKKKLEKKLRDPEYKAKWDAYDPEYQVIKTLIEARRKKNVTQKQLAEMTGITQPDISRLENGRGNPSLRTLNNLAKGLGMALKVEFVDVKKK